jgi:hypothetical protein
LRLTWILAPEAQPHLILDLIFHENTYFQATCALVKECPKQGMIASVIENYRILLAGRYGFVMQYAESSIYFTKSGFKQLFSTKEVRYKFFTIFSLSEALATV